MKTRPDDIDRLAAEVEAADQILEKLDDEIKGVGAPASYALNKRLEALRIEDRALHRNLAEAQQKSGSEGEDRRMRNVETLLHHIEAEEKSLEHDTEFLHQGPPTTIELTFRGIVRLLDPIVLKWKKFKGGRQWMWHSPFVNHTHKDLARRFKFPSERR